MTSNLGPSLREHGRFTAHCVIDFVSGWRGGFLSHGDTPTSYILIGFHRISIIKHPFGTIPPFMEPPFVCQVSYLSLWDGGFQVQHGLQQHRLGFHIARCNSDGSQKGGGGEWFHWNFVRRNQFQTHWFLISTFSNLLVGGLEHDFYFPYFSIIYGIILPID